MESTAFTVVVCTRNRAEHLPGTLDALEVASRELPFDLLVVDQSDRVDEAVAERVDEEDRWGVVHDDGRGLSRARNVAAAHAATPWIAFVDDDCHVEPAWSRALQDAIEDHPDVAMICGNVGERRPPAGDYLTVSAFAVEAPEIHAGPRVRPWDIGLGVCMAVRRDWIDRLGGWDERLGAGAPRFGAAEDMDFNYRLLRGGGSAFVTPTVRSLHMQWRPPCELPALYRRYMVGWCAFAIKTARDGDVAGGLWLWFHGLRDTSRMLASAVRRRSRLRARVGAAKLRGLGEGTAQALSAPW